MDDDWGFPYFDEKPPFDHISTMLIHEPYIPRECSWIRHGNVHQISHYQYGCFLKSPSSTINHQYWPYIPFINHQSPSLIIYQSILGNHHIPWECSSNIPLVLSQDFKTWARLPTPPLRKGRAGWPPADLRRISWVRRELPGLGFQWVLRWGSMGFEWVFQCVFQWVSKPLF